MRALCDTGSQLNLITKDAVARLRLEVKRVKASLIGVETSASESKGCVRVTIHVPGAEVMEEKFYVVNRVTRNLPFEPISLSNYDELNRLDLADPNFGTPSEVDALFGINIWVKILKNGVLKSADGLFAAQNTSLGWIIYKRETNQAVNSNAVLHTIALAKENDSGDLNDLLSKFWLVEDIPTMKTLTPDESECERIFQTSHSRERSGRYIVHLPFRQEKLKLLGKSKSIALKQFFAMERKMLKNSDFQNKYHDFMREFESLGHLTKINETKEDGYYTPHHGVVSSKKFRVVINASCPTSTGISLNDCQYAGAKLQKDLANILMKFRSFEFALTADIVKMFRQIEVAQAHQKYQKILWRYSPNAPVSVYQFNRVIYGQTASPFLAVRSMHQCAIDHSHEFPNGSRAVLECFYMDDCLTGADSIEDANNLKQEMIGLLKKGQFELAKWASNITELHRTENPSYLEIKEPEVKSVLGLRWIPNDDNFIYRIEPRSLKEIWTKRSILSEIGKLYDPNGYISPVVVSAKILMQRIWLSKLDWDEQILSNSSILNDWLKFMHSLPELNKISIPRWLSMKGNWQSELHTFSDASQDAYAAVVYVRTTDLDGNVTIRLVQSKTKVAPIKRLSIPRLELCGAHIAARLAETVLNEFSNQINDCHFWTDSEIVLIWLKKATHQLKMFVGNRIAAIQHKTIDKGFKWRWIAGESNPADVASRGTCASAIHNNHLWWNGPEWLALERQFWPKQAPSMNEECDDISNEMKIVAHVTINKPLLKQPWYNFNCQRPMVAYKNFKLQKPVPLLNAYGSFKKLVRVMATILRAIHNICNRWVEEPKTGPFTIAELSRATNNLILMDQELSFRSEMNALASGDANNNGTMFLDPNTNILRLNGRVTSDNLTFEEQYPILLSPKGELATLIIREAHISSLHGGVQQVLQLVRQKYWIPKGRSLTRFIINRCPTCFRYRAKWSKQLMAVLPKDRTTPGRPFKVCGVDYLGPVGLSSKIGRNPTITKAYVCVFVCFATRAVHLELVSGASTQQFMQALRRMTARRGSVRTIWSDNGTNFVGANNFLKEIYQKQYEWANGEVADVFQINWKFITPHAPHHGGLHEAAVKSTKHHLTRVIGKQNLTFEEYSTLLNQIEACLNSRPICPLSDDPDDLSPLTPAHFLVGEPLITLGEADNLISENQGRLTRYQLVQQMYQHFWSRWHTEYITTLSHRSKWKDEQRNTKVGDLVLLKEDNMAPSHWHIGRVKQTFPAPDGLVRSVLISTAHGDYKRPITKVGILSAEDDIVDLSKLNAKESFAKLKAIPK